MSPPLPTSLYLPTEPDRAFATLHLPHPDRARDTSVVFCPPFGWDDVSSYRSLRFWAERLAEAGYPTLRVSLPSTGDSGGEPTDAARVPAWTGAIVTAAEWLRNETRARRVTAIGIGLGGLLALCAAETPDRIDDLVLWGVPSTGRKVIRELRAFSKLKSAHYFEGLSSPPDPPPGQLEVAGFTITQQTISDLDAIAVQRLRLAPDPDRRVLVLERDGLVVDPVLREHMARHGVVESDAGDGFGDMTSHPQQARPPLAVIARVRDWLDAGSVPAPGVRRPTRQLAETNFTVRSSGDAAVRETAISVPSAWGRLSAILVTSENDTQPEHGLCAVLLNAGAVRRIGPNRMWVEAARRWAQQGIPTVRLDLEAIGDSDGDETPYVNDGALYEPKFVPQVSAVLDFLQRRGVGRRFVLGGVCSGAYWAFQTALRDPRVAGAMMINPRALVWEPGLRAARDVRGLRSGGLSLSKVRRAATSSRGPAALRWLLGAPARRLTRRQRDQDPVAAALEQFVDVGTRALLLFSEDQPVYDELVASGAIGRLQRLPQIEIERIAVRDHTLRPRWAQDRAHAALDGCLTRLLAESVPQGSGHRMMPAATA